MKKIDLLVWAILLPTILFLASCKKEAIVDPNEGELITTVKLRLTDLMQGNSVVNEFIFQDLDGEGGVAPQKFDTIVVSKGKNYKCEVILLNESVTPVDNVTEEVIAEGVDHQVYIQSNPQTLISVTNADKDANGLPLGITSYWTIGNAMGQGLLNVTLKHKPGYKKVNDNVAVGDTDLSIDFKLKVL